MVINKEGKCSASGCTGLDNCSKYCVMHAGKAIFNFFSGIDTVESKIGELTSSVPGSNIKDYVVSGHYIELGQSPSWISTRLSDTVLGAQNKFLRIADRSLIDIVREYCNENSIPNSICDEVVKKMINISSNKELILPFKPSVICKIDNDSYGIHEWKISGVEWKTDKEDHTLKCVIYMKPNNPNNSKLMKFGIESYLEMFRISGLDIQAAGRKSDGKIIKMTQHGVIKPIEFKSKTNTVAVDGTYAYLVEENKTTIIGEWKHDSLEMITNPNCNTFDRMMENINAIRGHRRYIAPYGTLEPNVVNVR